MAKLRQQAFTQSWWGEYYVKYNDGAESALMSKGCAKDYASIFGGEVFRAKPVYETHKVFFGLFEKREVIGYE